MIAKFGTHEDSVIGVLGSCRTTGEKWRYREDLGEVLIVIDDVLKAAKNIAWFLHSRDVLEDEGYPIGCIPWDGFFNMFRLEARKVQHCEVIRGLAVDCFLAMSPKEENVIYVSPMTTALLQQPQFSIPNNCQCPDAILQLICFILEHNFLTFDNQFAIQ
eukprot:g27848.t1